MKQPLSQQFILDCTNLDPTELRRRYPAEANSHRNLLQRAKHNGKIVHPDFRKFRNFLARVGPRPCSGATLDRIDNADPEYAPGKVRWADKRTQNSNKGDTLIFHYSRTNDTYTVSRLAKLQHVAPATVRKRLERGWTDDQIIEGRRTASPRELDRETFTQPRSPFRRSVDRRNRTKTGREIIWEQDAAFVAFHRETEGQEYCLADLQTLNEGLPSFCKPISQQDYDRKFVKWWWQYKPHLIRQNLPEWAQQTIASIEARAA